MVINKKDLLNYFIIAMVGMLGIVLIRSIQTPLFNSLVMWITAIVAMIIVKFDIFHPYTWFSGLFTLYSTGYALICSMGYNSSLGYSYHNIYYSYIGLMILLLIVGPKKTNIERKLKKKTNINYKTLTIILNIFSIFVFLVTVILIVKGYAGKSEMKKANDIFYRVGVYAVRYSAMFLTLFLCFGIENNEEKKFLPVMLSLVGSIFFSLYTGERDAMFRMVAVIALILFSYGKLKKKHMIIAIPLFVLFMILSVIFKYYFTNGIINTNFIANNNLLYMFLSTDFSSAGSNIQKLINTYWTRGYTGYSLFITEIFSPFLLSSVGFNPDKWFNYVVYTGGFHGRAFTLVGTGYIIDGLRGIIVLFIILGILVRCIYKNSKHSVYTLALYIYMIPTIIFASRQSLSTIFVALVRIALLSIAFCKLSPKFSSKKVEKGKDQLLI